MTRIRSSPANTDIFAKYEVFGPDVSDVVKGSLTTPYNDQVKTDSMEDVVTPGYFSLLKSGAALPVNTMTQSKYHIETSLDSLTQLYYRDGASPTLRATLKFDGNLASAAYATRIGTSSNRWFRQWSTTPSWPNSAAVLQEALAKANSSKFDLLTFAAEFNKTNEMVGKFGNRTLKRARDITDSMQRRYRRADHTYRVFSETWLEARYGWRILAYDLGAMNESIGRLMEGTPLRGRFSSYDEETSVYSEVFSPTITRWPSNTNWSSFIANVVGGFTSNYTRSVKAGVAVEHLGQDMYMSDPLVTAWEIVPFSFIADWFFTLGDAIKAHSPFASTNLLWSYVTTRETLETTCAASFESSSTLYSGLAATSYTGDGIPNSTALYRSTQYSRTPQTPTVSLDFDLNFDYKKALDLAALGGVFMSILGGKFNAIRGAIKL